MENENETDAVADDTQSERFKFWGSEPMSEGPEDDDLLGSAHKDALALMQYEMTDLVLPVLQQTSQLSVRVHFSLQF